VGERILALQPGIPHPIAGVLEAMTARWLRHSFAKTMGHSRALRKIISRIRGSACRLDT
jgi:hypothetical protein